VKASAPPSACRNLHLSLTTKNVTSDARDVAFRIRIETLVPGMASSSRIAKPGLRHRPRDEDHSNFANEPNWQECRQDLPSHNGRIAAEAVAPIKRSRKIHGRIDW
jgi:hypothetical protein